MLQWTQVFPITFLLCFLNAEENFPSLFFIIVLVILIDFLYQETKILHPQVLFEIIF